MGVFTTQLFKKHDFLLHYAGELVNAEEASQREKQYDRDKMGSFMYYFMHNGKEQW